VKRCLSAAPHDKLGTARSWVAGVDARRACACSNGRTRCTAREVEMHA
jgi:hypothetical protein